MIRSWCPARKVVAEQVQRLDIYAVCTPLEVPFKAKSEHCRLLNERVNNTRRSEGECNRECMRQAAWATRTVGGQWAASAGGALGCPALGDRDEVGAGWRGKGRRFSKTANGIAGNCEGHLLGKSCKLGYTFCQMSRTFVTAFRSTTWWSTSAINDLVTPPTATRPNPLYDAKFADFLATQEADPRCGRLKLRDWLLTIVHNVLDIYFCWRIFLAVQTKATWSIQDW